MRSFFKSTLTALTVLLSTAALISAAAAEEPKPPTPMVRVLVLENAKSLKLSVKGGYELYGLPATSFIQKGRELESVPVTASAAGIRVGNKALSVRGLRVDPAEERDLYINNSRFRGSVDIWSDPATQTLTVVNTVDIESYLYGVLHHEVAHWWPMEALKAQAVAARTYALYQMQVSRSQPYDLKSSTASQVYGGATQERFRAKRAVDMTRGQILTYKGRLFPAYFHATCAGMTAAASELWNIDTPPLKGGVPCDYCKISPHYYWHAKVPVSDIEQKLAKSGRPVGQILKIEKISQTPSGRVGSLRITGNADAAVVAAKDLRVWVGGDKLRSTDFAVSVHDDVAEFKGAGWGHGVGLCQWGALGQALIGRSCETILAYYYPGSVIGNYGTV